MNGSFKFRWGPRAPGGGNVLWPGPQGRAERAERPCTLTLPELRPGLNRSGAGRPSSATQRRARAVRASARSKLRARERAPPGVPTLSRPPAWLGRPGPGVLPPNRSPTPEATELGPTLLRDSKWNIALRWFSFLKCPAVSRCQSPVYQPFNSQRLRLSFSSLKMA